MKDRTKEEGIDPVTDGATEDARRRGQSESQRGGKHGAPQGPTMIEEILEPENLARAWKRVKANKGAPGTDGMTVLREYNGRCLPPWGEAQLLVKLRSAGRSARKRAGWRLEASRPTPVKAAPAEPEPWPDLRSPTNDEMRIIAKLRTLPVSILASARTWGILWSCRYGQTSTPAYAIKTAESCQLRKMDGSPWQFRDGHR